MLTSPPSTASLYLGIMFNTFFLNIPHHLCTTINQFYYFISKIPLKTMYSPFLITTPTSTPPSSFFGDSKNLLNGLWPLCPSICIIFISYIYHCKSDRSNTGSLDSLLSMALVNLLLNFTNNFIIKFTVFPATFVSTRGLAVEWASVHRADLALSL